MIGTIVSGFSAPDRHSWHCGLGLGALLLLFATVCGVATGPSPPSSAPTVTAPVCDRTLEIIPAPTPETLKPPPTPILDKPGIHLLLDDGRQAWPSELWEDHLGHAREAVGAWGYVTELIRRYDLDVARWQRFMDLCATLQLTPILRLATTYDLDAGWWRAPEPDADGTYRTVAGRYADFVADLRWPTELHYVIVGTEPNHGDEWSGRPDPAAYARFLIDVADVLKAADPQVAVLNADFDTYTPHTGSLSSTASTMWTPRHSSTKCMQPI